MELLNIMCSFILRSLKKREKFEAPVQIVGVLYKFTKNELLYILAVLKMALKISSYV